MFCNIKREGTGGMNTDLIVLLVMLFIALIVGTVSMILYLTDDKEEGGDLWKLKRYCCEHCGDTYERGGYDDSNFHQNVIPQMPCASCGKKADANYRPLTTKYPDEFVI